MKYEMKIEDMKKETKDMGTKKISNMKKENDRNGKKQ